MTARPCIDCGIPATGTRCEDCRPPDSNASSLERGYDSVFRRLSLRARRLQPWCTDCGTTEDLTCDHSPEAWRRKHEGKPIRLKDVDVCCRSCNSKRGRAKPARVDPPSTSQHPLAKAQVEMKLGTIITSEEVP